MTTVLLIVQLLICIVLIGLILIQRSEGGALGIGGGGGGGGGLMSGRSSANAVTKATTYLGAIFLLNSIALSVFYGLETQNTSRTAEDPTEQGLNIDPESSNSVTPLADDISVADPSEDLDPVDDAGTAPESDPEASSESTEDTSAPEDSPQ